jgi:hypothetical protein
VLLVIELQPIQAHEVLGLPDTPSAKIIRRNADGLRVTIDVDWNDRAHAVRVLEEVIGEIDGGDRNAACACCSLALMPAEPAVE